MAIWTYGVVKINPRVAMTRYSAAPHARLISTRSARDLMIVAAELPADVSIREGHRGLLTAFHEFAGRVDGPRGHLLAPDELRGAIAFLRQSLLPFAHWEDEQLRGSAEIAEDTAFEHAFLAAEVDALAGAVAELDRNGSGDGEGIARSIQRRVHRIEAVLELHVQKAEDRASLFSPPSPTQEGQRQGRAGAVREMEPAEIRGFLRRHEWGILCTVGEGAPYAVPVSYGFDGRDLYVASGPGRKRRNLETAAAVCITVAEVEDRDRWSSVVATGTAVPVRNLRARLGALRAIQRQRANGAPPSATDLARIARAAIFRISADQITGRVRG